MTAVATSLEFDICGPLPDGVTVLEASAGTGKTYTIAALTARYVAEGTPLDRMLLITFTRMATGELRDRVRERMVGCEQELSRILKGARDPGTDSVVTLLASGLRPEVELRRDRLARAVADFDAATIATTHGFCQEVLAELGTVGDLEPGTAFVEDVSDLLEEVVDDLYLRRFHARGNAPISRADAWEIARAAVFNPMTELEPSNAPANSTAAMRYRLAVAVRRELENRKRRLAIMTYDDLLTRLNETLDGPSGPAARERLRSRFGVVLVDEFQDTDPIQWQILRRAFDTAGVTLVLVADPKQAIYAFRGADVYAYLTAASTAHTHRTLQVNRRMDQPLVDAYDALFAGARLGHKGIVYRNIKADAVNQKPRLLGAPSDAALRIRVVHRDEPTIDRTKGGFVTVASAREHVACALAADVVALLSSGAKIEHRAPDGRLLEREPICPRHIAVLVRSHKNAELVSGELEAARVPAVLNGAGSVFATKSARHWLRLLEALERPASTLRAKAAALTPFLGWTAEQLALASEEQWEQVHRRLHRWSRILREQGVAAVTESIMISEDLPARMLAAGDGERDLTDLRHIAQLLHGASSGERLGGTALRAWLAQRVADAELDQAEEERTRRLESDAEAVQVLTIHRSKGLEFPVVYCPFLWDLGYKDHDDKPVFFHDLALGDRRTVDVGLEGRGFDAHVRQHRNEQRGEDLRLAYVALTRAKHQAVIWWAGSRDTRQAALTRLLFAKDADGDIAPAAEVTPEDKTAVARFEELAAAAPGRVSIERSSLRAPSEWSPAPKPPAELFASKFDRQLDLRWRRTSYTDITAEAHDPLVASEPEEQVITDEPEAPTPVPGAGAEEQPDPELDRPSLLESMPVGVGFGTFVHRVLEATDFAAADLDGELAEQIAAAQSRRALDLGDPRAAVDGLRAAIETPLGAPMEHRRLRDFARSDRLDELEFELPLVGGDDPSGRLTLTAIAAVLRTHLSSDDPMATYAARLEDPTLRSSVRGFLTGSIDLVVRLEGPRFAIADYKTNWLGPFEEPLTLRHYRPRALAAEMSRAHYGLQALLYTVALHRYLRWRVRTTRQRVTSRGSFTCSYVGWPVPRRRPRTGPHAESSPGVRGVRSCRL